MSWYSHKYNKTDVLDQSFVDTNLYSDWKGVALCFSLELKGQLEREDWEGSEEGL